MPPQLQTAREIFDVLDADGGGSISAEEMGVGLQRLGHHCTQAELHALVAKLDADGSGTLEFEEFEAAAQHFLNREDSQYTRHVADLQYLGNERPPVVRKLRPAERQALVDQEWARIRKERREMASWREDMTTPEPEPEQRQLTDAQQQELQRHPVERGIVAHERNTEKLSEYREAAHAKALTFQAEGTAHMKARRYSQAALCFKQALTEGPTSVAYKDFLDSWKVAELERDLARAEEMAAMKDRAQLMGHMSAAELAMRDKMDKNEQAERELMQHHVASDYKAAAPPTSLAGLGGTSAPTVPPEPPPEEFLQVTDDFKKHFNAEAASLERERAHTLAKQALDNYTDFMKAAKYTHAASVVQSALQRELDTRRLVDWLDPWRILEMEQAVKNALQMDKTLQEEQRQAVCVPVMRIRCVASVSPCLCYNEYCCVAVNRLPWPSGHVCVVQKRPRRHGRLHD
jgi:tetratricopeptide (TPR) repeat protein